MNIFDILVAKSLEQSVNEEDIDEAADNDIWAARFFDFRLVRIPNRTVSGKLDVKEPSRLVKIDWHCPYCGQIMDEPQLQTFTEDGITYQASVWNTLCGCQVKYNNLTALDDRMPERYSSK